MFVDDCKTKYSTDQLFSGPVEKSTLHLSPYPDNHNYFQLDLDWDDAHNGKIELVLSK